MSTVELKNYQKNIPKIYWYSYFYMSLVIVPVIVPFFTSLNLTMEEVFIIQAFFGLSMALFEVPSAYLGDLWGRKNVMILGSLINGIGFSLLFFAKDFWSLLIYEIILGIGASFVSGADLAILYDSIGDDRNLKTKAIGNLHAFHLIGEALAAILCGVLVVYGFNAVIWGQVIVGWIPFFIALTIIEPEIERMDKNKHKDNISEVLRYIFRDDNFLRLIFINLVIWSLSTFMAIWIIQKYWQLNGITLSQIGYFWAFCNFIAAISGKVSPRLEARLGPQALLVLMASLSIGGYLIMGLVGGGIGVLAAISFYLARGVNGVVMREAFNHRIPSKFRNTANSLSSLFFRLGFFLVGPLIGFSIDEKGMSFSLGSLGVVYFGIFLLLLLPLILRLKEKQKT